MMMKSINMRNIAPLVSTLCVSCFLIRGECGAQERDSMDRRMLGPLVTAGIQVDDEGALIATVRGVNANLATRAAYALGKRPKSQQSITALTALIGNTREPARPSESDLWDLAAVEAARTLAKFHETAWIPSARDRIPRIDNIGIRMQMAAALASAGAYDAWPIVHENLVSSPYDHQALFWVPSFVGMKHSDGSEVNLESLITSLIPSMSEDRRKEAQAVIAEIRKRKAH